MYGFIYLTINKINGKMYIGKRVIRNRKEDFTYLGSGVLLKQSIVKYGSENFTREILSWCQNKEILETQEKLFIQNYNAIENDKFYNIAEGGAGGDTRAGKSEEELAEWHSKISKANKGKAHTEEYKKNSSKRMMGDKNPMFGLHGENNPIFGRKHSDETKEKMSLSRKGKNKVIVKITYPNGETVVFDGLKAASENLGISEKAIRENSKKKTPYKPFFKRLKYLEGIIMECYYKGEVK